MKINQVWSRLEEKVTMTSLSCCVFSLFLINTLAQGQFFDDYTAETEYKGKFIGALNSYHHQVCYSGSIRKLRNTNLGAGESIKSFIGAVFSGGISIQRAKNIWQPWSQSDSSDNLYYFNSIQKSYSSRSILILCRNLHVFHYLIKWLRFQISDPMPNLDQLQPNLFSIIQNPG